jgi:hypothetical protein
LLNDEGLGRLQLSATQRLAMPMNNAITEDAAIGTDFIDSNGLFRAVQ